MAEFVGCDRCVVVAGVGAAFVPARGMKSGRVRVGGTDFAVDELGPSTGDAANAAIDTVDDKLGEFSSVFVFFFADGEIGSESIKSISNSSTNAESDGSTEERVRFDIAYGWYSTGDALVWRCVPVYVKGQPLSGSALLARVSRHSFGLNMMEMARLKDSIGNVWE